MIYKIVIFLVITLSFLFLFKHYMEKLELFANNSNSIGMSVNDITGDSLNAAVAPVVETVVAENPEVKCKAGDWWDDKPIKAIRSKLWGASYNLTYQTNGNINTPVLIPINNPNSSTPAGCLAVTETGWHEVAMCAEKDVNQRWQIKLINNQEDFETAITTGKSNGTVGFTYGYKIDKVDYPFFIVVSKEHPSQSLYYNGSALGVRPIGNYDDLKWDILPAEIKAPIVTNDFNYYSKLTPEMHSSGNGEQVGSQLHGFQDLSSNPQALASLLQTVLKQPNTGGDFGVTNGGLKINVEMDDAVINQLTSDGMNVPSVNTSISRNMASNVSGNNVSSSTVTEPFTNFAPYYPKKPMDIAVTLNYSVSSANQTNEQTKTSEDGTEIIDINKVDEEGNLIKVGETKMNKKSGDILLAHLRSIDFYNKLPLLYVPPNAYWYAFTQIEKN